MSDPQKIGLMDWGIGGFSVYAALRASGSTADVVYLSDSGNTSYGKLSAAEMRARFLDVGPFFRARGVREVLVGCNAASSALAGDVESFEGVEFHSIIPAGVRAAQASRAKSIGVIGGDLTIASGVYQKRLVGPRYRFQSAQPLSSFVERGDLENDEAVNVIFGLVAGQIGLVDALLLACTHYPALADCFDLVIPATLLLDPAPYLIEAILPPPGRSTLTFYTTGSSGSAAIARRAFGVDVPEPVRLEIDLQLSPAKSPA
jgi:glutamate racemase